MAVEVVSVDGESDEAGDFYEVFDAAGIHLNRCEEPFLAALDGDEVVGGVALDQGDGCWWSFSVAVRPGRQGDGVGKALIRRLLAEARAADSEVERVEADVVNARLRTYLRSLGFCEEPGSRVMFQKI